jgi:hypothetical protein
MPNTQKLPERSPRESIAGPPGKILSDETAIHGWLVIQKSRWHQNDHTSRNSTAIVYAPRQYPRCRKKIFIENRGFLGSGFAGSAGGG